MTHASFRICYRGYGGGILCLLPLMLSESGRVQLDVVPDVVPMWSQLDVVLPTSRRSSRAPNLTLTKLHLEKTIQCEQRKLSTRRAAPGIEPGTARTQTENRDTRPSSRRLITKKHLCRKTQNHTHTHTHTRTHLDYIWRMTSLATNQHIIQPIGPNK